MHPTILQLAADGRRHDLGAEADRGRLAAQAVGRSLVGIGRLFRRDGPRLSRRSSFPIVVRHAIPDDAMTARSIGTSKEKPMRRLATLALILGLLVSGVLAAGPAGAAPAARSCDPCEVETTAALNLRSGPGTNYEVLTVIRAGGRLLASVTATNGFREVVYNGFTGWAHQDYLSFLLVEPSPSNPGPMVRTASVTVDLNLRTGPSTSNQVLRVMGAGDAVQFSETLSNGYRYVIHDGLAGWAADQYLSFGVPQGPQTEYLTTTADLNLRDGPSTADRVLTVMPSGVSVRVGDQFANGYRLVTYNGVSGWAAVAYLT